MLYWEAERGSFSLILGPCWRGLYGKNEKMFDCFATCCAFPHTAGWIEGVKLSDRERGWFPSEHVELISSKHARQKNLKEEQRVKNAKQQVFCKK